MANVITSVVDLVLLDAMAANGASTPVSIGGLTSIGLQVTGLNGAALAAQMVGYNPKGAHQPKTIGFLNLNTNLVVTSIIADGFYSASCAGGDVLSLAVSGYVSGAITVTAKGYARA